MSVTRTPEAKAATIEKVLRRLQAGDTFYMAALAAETTTSTVRTWMKTDVGLREEFGRIMDARPKVNPWSGARRR